MKVVVVVRQLKRIQSSPTEIEPRRATTLACAIACAGETRKTTREIIRRLVLTRK